MKKLLSTFTIACAVLFGLSSCAKTACDVMADSLEEMVNVCCETGVDPSKAIATIKNTTAEIRRATEMAKANPAAARDDMVAFKGSQRYRSMMAVSKGFGHSFEMMKRLNPEVQSAEDEMNAALAEFVKACK